MGRAAEIWGQLEPLRSDVLERAREVASLTVPSLMPPDGTNDTSRLPTPYQGTGAEGVNNLSSKLLLALYPPSVPSFRLVVDRNQLRIQAAEEGIEDETLVSKVEEQVSLAEQEIHRTIESLSIRPELFENFRHLVVVGNYMFRWEGKDGLTLRGFPLDQYVVKRDAAGTILRGAVREADPAGGIEGDPESKWIYSGFERKVGKKGVVTYRLWQEHGDRTFAAKTVAEEDFPYLLPVLYRRAGESYGRGVGEQYLGDLISLEALAAAIVQGSAAAAHLVWLVNPNGFTKIRDLQRAKTGAYISGLPDDINALQLDKQADLQIAAQTAERLERKLNRVFLLNSAVQRNAERVTAEEIRYVAQELEVALGGAYSLLTEQLQLPVVQWVMRVMEREGSIPEYPDDLVTPKVVTGIEGLGRNLELDRLRVSNGVLLENLPAEVVLEYINIREFVRRVFTSAGVDGTGLILSEEQVQAARQAARQNAIAQAIAAPIAGAAAGPAAQAIVDNANTVEE